MAAKNKQWNERAKKINNEYYSRSVLYPTYPQYPTTQNNIYAFDVGRD